MIGSEGILRHQNRQLASALKLAKTELSSTQTRLKQLENDRDLFDATTSVLDRSWRLLDTELAGLAQNLGVKHIPRTNDTVDSDNQKGAALPASSRLIQVLAEASDKYILSDATKLTVDANGTAEDDDDDDDDRTAFNFDERLKQRIQWTTSLLARVLAAITSKENGVDTATPLQAQVHALTARVQLLGSRLVVSRKKIKELQLALEEAKGEVWRLTRRLDSLQEEGLSRPASTSVPTSAAPEVTSDEQQGGIERPVSAMSRSSSALDVAQATTTTNNEAEIRKTEDPEARATLEEVKAVAASRLAELEQIRQELRSALSKQTIVVTFAASAGEVGVVSSNELSRELDRQKQQCAALMRQADRATAISHSALQKLSDAEARIEQLESASDAIIKATESSLKKENARLKQALDETRKALDDRLVEIERLATVTALAEEKDRLVKALTEERDLLKQKLEHPRDKSNGPEANEALIAEIEQINNALTESRESCSRLQQLLMERERRVEQLSSEKSSMESDLREIREEKNALALRSEKVQAVQQESEAYVSRLEDRLMSEKATSQKAEELAKTSLDQCEKALAEVEELKRELEAQKERASTIPQLEEEIRNTKLQMEDIKWDLSRSEEEVQTLKRRLDRAKAALEAAARAAASSSSGVRGATTSKSIDEERLEAMNHALRCPVYQHLWKDCVITKCAHMFSRKALEDNLAQRNRKCPSCKNTYSKDDILNVYLYQSNDV